MLIIALDTETTGVDPNADSIVEIACVWEEGGSLQHDDQLCNPGRIIPPEAMAVHHITNEMVVGETDEREVVQSILGQFDFKDCVFVAHNAAFDRGMLVRLIPEIANCRWVCTWRCALHLYPDASSHGNQALRYALDLQMDLPKNLYPHRALYDTITTHALLKNMLHTHTIEQLIELSNTPVLLKTIRFGKHKGMLWSDVPRDYLSWISRQEMDLDTIHTAKYWINNR